MKVDQAIEIVKKHADGVDSTTGWTIEREARRHEYKDGVAWQERWAEDWTYDSTGVGNPVFPSPAPYYSSP